MTRTLLCTTALALATASLAAPTALARPDAGVPAAKAAVPALHKGVDRTDSNGFPTRPIIDRSPAQPHQPSSPPVTVSVASADRGIDWATIGIGIAGSLLAVGAIALITDRMRHPRARISA
jgi:hypothetical protein